MEEGVRGDDDRAAATSREVAATPRWDCVSGERAPIQHPSLRRVCELINFVVASGARFSI